MKRAIEGVAWLLLCGAALVQLVMVVRTASSVPFWDEWHFLGDGALPGGLATKWLFAQHNEHRIVLTKLQNWLVFRWAGWDLSIIQLSNFAIYLGIVAAWLGLARLALPEAPRALAVAYAIFFFSPLDRENHTWGFQSQFHFVVLLSLLACIGLFHPQQQWRHRLLGAAAVALLPWSFSSGVPGAIALSVAYLIWVYVREPRAGQGYAWAVLGVALISCALWAHDYHKPGMHPDLVLPHKSVFWLYLGNYAAFGFGVQRVSTAIALAVLLASITPLLLLLGQVRRPGNAMLLACALCFWAFAATTAMGRAGFGVDASKYSRYYEFAMLLPAVGLLAWWRLLANRPAAQRALVAAWLVVALVAQADNLGFEEYEQVRERKQNDLACIGQYYATEGDHKCPNLFPVLVDHELDTAKRLQLKLYRDAVRMR